MVFEWRVSKTEERANGSDSKRDRLYQLIPSPSIRNNSKHHPPFPLISSSSYTFAVSRMFPTLPALAKPLSSPISQPFKRSQLGLFGGKTKQYGNNVPFSKHKTRRSWLPNVQSKRLTSEALGEELKLKVTTRALRSIKKVCSTSVHAPLRIFLRKRGRVIDPLSTGR